MWPDSLSVIDDGGFEGSEGTMASGRHLNRAVLENG